MILYALFSIFIFVLGLITNLLTGIPGINELNTAIEPYIQAISNLLTSGMDLVGFFIPIGLIKVLLPVVIIIEIVVENLDVIKFAMKKVLGR